MAVRADHRQPSSHVCVHSVRSLGTVHGVGVIGQIAQLLERSLCVTALGSLSHLS